MNSSQHLVETDRGRNIGRRRAALSYIIIDNTLQICILGSGFFHRIPVGLSQPVGAFGLVTFLLKFITDDGNVKSNIHSHAHNRYMGEA